MRYSDDLIEEVRMRNDIVGVLSGFLSLKKKGRDYECCCPFHNEKTPSFKVSPEKQMYHCFGCGVGGNVFTFLMEYERYSFQEAVKYLADRAGIKVPDTGYTAEEKRQADRKTRILEVNKEAATFFYYQLRSPHGETGLKYLEKRELTKETMQKFGLGYAGKNGTELVGYLRKKGFEDELIKEAGLATYSEKRGMTSQFWNRVMFPIMDINKHVIGFGGRVMGDGEPKYLNSPETKVFDKKNNLYGLNYAKYARCGNLILCEGYMDVIALHQAGFTQAVASLGTAFTEEQARLLKRYTQNVLLAYDSDGAGVKAALKGIGILREAGLSGKVINMKPYKDPDEFIKNLGTEAFQERIDQAENSFFFEVRILSEQFDMQDPEQKTKFHREIAKKLCDFSEDAERENYLQAIADKYYITVDGLRKLVTGYAAQVGGVRPVERPRSGLQERNSSEDNARKAQRRLITWITEEPQIYDKIKKFITPDDFTEEIYQKVVEKVFEGLENGNFQPAGIVSMFEDEEQQRKAVELFNIELPQLNTRQDREMALKEIVLAVKRNSCEFYGAKVDVNEDAEALLKVIARKKALEELAKTHISLE